MRDLQTILRPADVLIVVPPFSTLIYPSLGAHLLQAIGAEEGARVQVLYANVLLAAEIGRAGYELICDASLATLLGERFFARLAYGLPPLGQRAEEMFSLVRDYGEERAARVDLDQDLRRVDLEAVRRLEAGAGEWLERVVDAIVDAGYPVVGCTSMFQQTAAGVALLDRVKRRRPQTVTLLGGANCEGEMGEGLAALDALGASIDHIFSGESEATFRAFLRGRREGRPGPKIFQGAPLTDMDALPTPVLDDYYEQLAAFLGDSLSPADTWITYETSRGCWWGQRQHCTFCGLNGEGMRFREKSAGRVLSELADLERRYPSRNVMMSDNIMPFTFFKTLLPELGRRGSRLNLFYEQKANLTLEKVLLMKRAGISTIQPGIEALSTRLLKRMRKGVSAYQNLMLLRYARAAGVEMTWNLLWGFPGDEPEAYEETLALLPLIHHLEPPSVVGQLSIDRFSPYFFEPDAHGVRNVRPLAAYGDVFPEGTVLAKVAYHFVADFPSGGYDRIDTIHALRREVARWQQERYGPGAVPPQLRIGIYEGEHALIDTRGLPGTEEVELIDRDTAGLLLTGRSYLGTAEEDRAVERRLAVVMDGWFLPLATAEPELLLAFEAEPRTGQTSEPARRGTAA